MVSKNSKKEGSASEFSMHEMQALLEEILRVLKSIDGKTKDKS